MRIALIAAAAAAAAAVAAGYVVVKVETVPPKMGLSVR